MAVVEELLREESDGTISFGNHELAEKKKLEKLGLLKSTQHGNRVKYAVCVC